jgi:hypothetical protein
MIIVFVFVTTDEIEITSQDDGEFGASNFLGDFP